MSAAAHDETAPDAIPLLLSAEQQARGEVEQCREQARQTALQAHADTRRIARRADARLHAARARLHEQTLHRIAQLHAQAKQFSETVDSRESDSPLIAQAAARLAAELCGD